MMEEKREKGREKGVWLEVPHWTNQEKEEGI